MSGEALLTIDDLPTLQRLTAMCWALTKESMSDDFPDPEAAEFAQTLNHFMASFNQRLVDELCAMKDRIANQN